MTYVKACTLMTVIEGPAESALMLVLPLRQCGALSAQGSCMQPLAYYMCIRCTRLSLFMSVCLQGDAALQDKADGTASLS